MNELEVESPYASLAALRADHRRLQKLYRDDSTKQHDQIESFIRRGRATGTILSDEHDQAAAQSLLDFWATTLYRSHRPVPESALMPFDPSLAPLLDDGVVPYVGLDSFAEQKKDLFFGRARAVESLVARLQTENLVAVIGPSGSGKSSVVLAGVLPALKAGAVPGSDAWAYLGRIVPGANALKSLARVLGREAGHEEELLAEISRDPAALLELVEQLFPGRATLLVIDQFEEVSTLCEDGDARAIFENAVAHLVTHGTVRHIVILTMRSDFIGAVARQPALQQILETALEHLTPLTASELREAIERPAELIGLKFESGVVEALVHDILGEPAALPLLQFTLLKLWEGRDHNRVTMEAYRALGGGRLALTKTADTFMAALIPQDRVMADRIFLRLVRPGIGQDNVSGRLPRTALYSLGPPEHVDRVLDKLIDERLVRITGDADADAEIEVAHEALVRNWLYLVKLLDGERELQKTRVRLEAKAAEWLRLGRGEAGLLKGAALVEAEDWLRSAESEAHVSDQLRALVETSHKASRRSKRRLKLLTAAAFALAAFAFWGMISARQASARATAESARATAESARATAESARATSEAKKNLALTEERARRALEEQARIREDAIKFQKQTAELNEQQRRRLLIEKDAALAKARQFDASSLVTSANAVLTDDPEAATLLSLQGALLLALNNQPIPPNVHASFYQAVQANRLRGTIPTVLGEVPLAFSPDSRRFVTGGTDHQPRVWDTTTHKQVLTIPVARATAAAYSWNNEWLAIAGDSVRIFDAVSGRALATLEPPVTGLTRLTFSPDGQFLAGVGSEPQAHLWSMARNGSSTKHQPLQDTNQGRDAKPGCRTSDPASSDQRPAAFSPTGAFLATAGSDKCIRIWATDTGEPLATLTGHQKAINDLVFLPDGYRLLSADDGGTVRLWRPLPLTSGPLQLPGALGASASALSDDSTSLQVSATAPIRALGVMPDGLRVMAVTRSTGPSDTTVLAAPSVSAVTVTGLEVPPNPTAISVVNTGSFTLPASEATDIRISPNATLLITGGAHAATEIWSSDRGTGTVLGTRLGSINRLSASTRDTFLSMSPGTSSAIVREWDLRRPGQELVSAFEVPGRLGAFSSDGQRAAVVCQPPACNGTAIVNLATRRIEHTIAAATGQVLALNSDGSMLASTTSSTFGLWNGQSGTLMTSLPLTAVSAVAFSPDGVRIAVATSDNNVHLLTWNGQQIASHKTARGPARASNLVFSADGISLAVVGLDRTISVWNVASSNDENPQVTATLSGHTSLVRGVAFSRDGRYLVSGGDDRTVRVWDLTATGPASNLLLTITVGPRGVSGVAFAQDMTGILATADDGTLRWFPGWSTTLPSWAFMRLTREFKPNECRLDSCEPLQTAIDDIVEGNRLAVAGDEGAATAKYEAARRRIPSLPLESQAQAKQLASETRAAALRQEARGLLLQIEVLARASRIDDARALLPRLSTPLALDLDVDRLSATGRRVLATNLRGLAQTSGSNGNRTEALRLLQRAKVVDPSQVSDVESELRNLTFSSEQQRARTLLLELNLVPEAVNALKSLRAAGLSSTEFDTNAYVANELCWRGSLYTLDLAKEPEVRNACEHAVTLTKEANSSYSDSRGLNRARNGDFSGAIADFKKFAGDLTKSKALRDDRERWIEKLAKQENPFTSDVLADLR
jgi:WD40 repeat protein